MCLRPRQFRSRGRPACLQATYESNTRLQPREDAALPKHWSLRISPPCNSSGAVGFHRLATRAASLAQFPANVVIEPAEGRNVSKRPRSQQDVDHMEFLLTLRRRGIADKGVLRAMDE